MTELTSSLNLQVVPSSGCIPGGGAIELKLDVCPSVVGAFDVKLCVCIRESKQLLIRLSGTVEQPSLTVEKVSRGFLFLRNFLLSVTFSPILVVNLNICRSIVNRL